MGSSPTPRRRSASATATAVLPTPVGPKIATTEAGAAAREGLRGAVCDLAVVFASGAHLAAPEALLEALHEVLEPEQLIGCGAGGVIGSRREIEDGTAVSIWAANLGDGTATAFHASVEEIEEGARAPPRVPGVS